MTKGELIKRLEEINVPDDIEVVFPNVEFGGLESINNVRVERVHSITDEGRKRRPVTGCDFVDEKEFPRDPDVYNKEKQKVIVLHE